MPFQPPSKPNFNKDYLIFDFDETIGTLLMDWTDVYGGMLRVIQKYEPTFALPSNQINSEHVNAELENSFIKKFGKPLRLDLVKFHQEFEVSHYTGCQPNPAVVEFIKNAQGFEVFVWSNNHVDALKLGLKDLNLETAFKRIVTCDMVLFSKPHPEGFSHLSVAGSSLEQYLMIGDSSNDEKAAAAAGIDFLHVDDFVRLIKK